MDDYSDLSEYADVAPPSDGTVGSDGVVPSDLSAANAWDSPALSDYGNSLSNDLGNNAGDTAALDALPDTSSGISSSGLLSGLGSALAGIAGGFGNWLAGSSGVSPFGTTPTVTPLGALGFTDANGNLTSTGKLALIGGVGLVIFLALRGK